MEMSETTQRVDTASDRLHRHYDAKYASTTTVEATSLVKHPQDRFQMAVWVASRRAGGRYLEIGAGAGSVMLALRPYYTEMVGADLSAVRVRDLQRLYKGDSAVSAIQLNIDNERLPYADNYFSTAVMIAVIEHLIDPITALREIHRVLQPGGRLIVDTPNIAKWTRRIKLAAGYFPSTASLREGLICYDKKTPTDLYDEGHFHYFTFRSLRNLALERTGFVRAENYGYGRWPLCKWWPTLFSEVAVVLYKGE